MSTTETLTPIDPEPLLTTKQVAAWLSMKENYVYAESAAGRMPSVPLPPLPPLRARSLA